MSQENTREGRRLKAEGNVHGLGGDGCQFVPKFKGYHGKGEGGVENQEEEAKCGGWGEVMRMEKKLKN